MTTVVVTGVTGNVGRHVVSELRRRGVPHRALTRDPERAAAVLGPDADLAQGDFTDPESPRAAFAGAEQACLICANDPRRVENAANAIEAAATAGVRQVVLLSTVEAEVGATKTFADQHVAACAVAVLSGQSGDGETHLITGPEAITFTEVARRLSTALGRTVEYVPVPDEAQWIPAQGLADRRASCSASSCFSLCSRRRFSGDLHVLGSVRPNW